MLSTGFNTFPPYFKVESKITRDFAANARCLPIIISLNLGNSSVYYSKCINRCKYLYFKDTLADDKFLGL